MNKNYILVLITVVAIFLNFNKLKAQSLSVGDIAFIGMNADSPEGYSFITLTDISGSEVIFFSDRGIISTASYIAGDEGTYRFTAPAAGIPCGTIVSFDELTSDVYTITGVSGATMTKLTGSANLGTADQIYAYQTTGNVISAVPSDATFIAGVQGEYDASCIDPVTKWTQAVCVSSTSESIVPPGLTNGVNCVSVTPAGPEKDNLRYSGTLTGTSTALLAAINDFTNWETTDAGAYDIKPSGYASPSVDCSTLSIYTFDVDNTIKIYPNPSSAIIRVTGLKTTELYTIYGILGNKILEGKTANNEAIDIDILSKGMYFLKIKNKTPIKFIKE